MIRAPPSRSCRCAPARFWEEGDRPLVPAAAWADTHLAFDAARAGRRWRKVLTGETVSAADGRMNIAEALKTFPVALLAAG